MKIMKFGGTSVGSPERIRNVAQIATKSGEPVFLVLSAMSGTTNTLVEICNYLYKKNAESANEKINELENKYSEHVNNLYNEEKWREDTRLFLKERFDFLRSFTKEIFTSFEEKDILAQGEIMSTRMMLNHLLEQGVKAALIPALDFMRTDKNNNPDSKYISKHLNSIINEIGEKQVYITQGFICRNAYGETDNLLRGGSDYTASIVGAAINSEEIQIWTDIDGLHNNDPRIVKNTRPVRELNYEEAAELAYFGAKILHPTCIIPAKYARIPVRLKYTMEPDSPGTVINGTEHKGTIKAVAVKEDIAAIKVRSSRMLQPTGFLRKVFEIFESYGTTTDLICTSEVGVSLTIDNKAHIDEITEELKEYGTVCVDDDMCIICIVGDLDWKNVGFETIAANALKDIPLRMISYGGSNYNISFLVRQEDKVKALQLLSDNLFQTYDE